MREQKKDDRWTDEDLAPLWYMLFQNSTNSNIGNRALVTRRYCQMGEAKEKLKLYSFLRTRKKRKEK